MLTNKKGKTEQIIVYTIMTIVSVLLIFIVMFSVSTIKNRAGKFKDAKFRNFDFYYYVNEHLVEKKDGTKILVRYLYISTDKEINQIPETYRIEQIRTNTKSESEDERYPKILNTKKDGKYQGRWMPSAFHLQIKSQVAKTVFADKYRKEYQFNIPVIKIDQEAKYPDARYEIYLKGIYFLVSNQASISLRGNSNLVIGRKIAKNVQVVDLSKNGNIGITIVQRNFLALYFTVLGVFLTAFLIYILTILIRGLNSKKHH